MDPASFAQLDRSHRRHDAVMDDLLAAARRLAMGRPEPDDTDAIHRAVAFFQRAVKRHFLDEEGSVFPRLSTRRPQLAEELATLSSEHPAQIAVHHAIAEAARGLTGSSLQGAGKRVLELAERLAELHHSHVAREDRLFELAHDALTVEDDAEIVTEMETRRDRDGERDSGRGTGMGRRSSKPTTNLKKPLLAASRSLLTKKPKLKLKPKRKPTAKRKKAATTAKAKAKSSSQPKQPLKRRRTGTSGRKPARR